MTKKVFNMEGGLHSAAAYSAFENRAYGSCVASTDSFVVTPGTGMNARISAGDGLIDTGLNFARRIQSDAQETVSVEPASTSYNRIDSVVAYIDTSVTPTTSVVDNTNGILKFASIAGTAASSPQAPNQAAIQSAIGAGNPYMVLYNITVPTNATNLTGATFTDMRKVINIVDPVTQIPEGSITPDKIPDGSIPVANMNLASFYRQLLNTSAGVPSDFFMQYGWGWVHGDGTSKAVNKLVSFPVPYTSTPIVLLTCNGAASAQPTDLSQGVAIPGQRIRTGAAADINLTRFRATIMDDTPAAVYYLFSWVAIGNISRT